MLLNLQGGHAIAKYLDPELRFHGQRDGEMGREEMLDLFARRPGRFVPGEPEMRRNLVMVSWERREGEEVVDSGTWFLSFDREGRVREWSEISA